MMHRSDTRRWWKVPIAALLMATAWTAGAQQSTPPPDIRPPDGMPDHDREIYTLVNDIMQVRLQRTLELDGRGFDALMTCLGESRKELVRLKWQRGYVRESLRAALKNGADDTVITKRLDALLDMEDGIVASMREMIDSAGDCLNTAQTARLYLFVDDFETYLSTLVEQARGQGGHHSGVDRPLPRSESGDTPEADSDDAQIPNQNTFVNLVRRENQDARLQDYAADDVVALVDALLMIRLTERLGLASSETAALFKRVGDYKDQLHSLKWIIGDKRASLRDALDDRAPVGELEERVDDLLLQEEAVARIIRVFIEEARSDLTERQAADLYLFLGDFEEYVVGLLQRANALSGHTAPR
jgi:hypothetical protein